MFKKIAAAALASALLLAGGCGPKKPPPPTVHQSMTDVIQPQAQTIWDVTNGAFNDFGDGLDPARISAADWIRLENAGRRLGDGARVLAKAGRLTAATPGVPIEGEGESGPGAVSGAQVQSYIDADRPGFARHARVLAQAGDTVVKASRARDVVPLMAVANGLDEVCDACHEKFWAPQEAPRK